MRRMHRSALGIPEPKRWRYNKTIRKLAKSGKVEISDEDGKLFIRLTQKGRLAGLLFKLDKGFRKQDHWDGKWRLAIWDIPESSKKQRNALRWFLKRLGFFKLQKSVFITPHELPMAAVRYLEESDLMHFIRFLRVDKMDNDIELKQYFSLGAK